MFCISLVKTLTITHIHCCTFCNPFFQNYTFEIKMHNEQRFEFWLIWKVFSLLVMMVLFRTLTAISFQDNTKRSRFYHKRWFFEKGWDQHQVVVPCQVQISLQHSFCPGVRTLVPFWHKPFSCWHPYDKILHSLTLSMFLASKIIWILTWKSSQTI